MIIKRNTLNKNELSDVEGLRSLCEKYDNALTCIQIDHTLNFHKDMKNWFLYYEDNNLVGICSVFAPMEKEAEISLCVKPDRRRRGIAKKLFEETQKEMNRFNVESLLTVVDEKSKSGMDFLSKLKLKQHHTEYTLHYQNKSIDLNENGNKLFVRNGNIDDMEAIIKVCASAYNDSHESITSFIQSNFDNKSRKSFVCILGDAIIGTCFLGYESNSISINTVAIVKEEQGKGYGKEMLIKVLDAIKEENKSIYLEVDSSNFVAYSLYKNIGFKETQVIQYYLFK